MGIPWAVLGIVLYWRGVNSLWFTVLSAASFAGYEIVGTALFGQTVGKHLAGIRVCSGRDLGPPGWLRAAKRWGIYFVVGFVPIVGGLLTALIPLPLLWTANRQGLHDSFADTLVLRTDALKRRADVAAAWGTWA